LRLCVLVGLTLLLLNFNAASVTKTGGYQQAINGMRFYKVLACKLLSPITAARYQPTGEQ